MALTEAEELELLELEEAERLNSQPNGTPSKQNGIQRFLPTIGAIGAGTLASLTPPPVRVAAAGLGAGAGEALNQMISRIRGQEAPMTSVDAARRIAKESSLASATEAIVPSALKLAGKIARPVVKGASKLGSAFSGTPAVNLQRAYRRGLLETYFPKGQALKTRATAGEEQAKIQNNILSKFFSPTERVGLRIENGKQAQDAIEAAMLKQEIAKDIGLKSGSYLNPKEAVAVRQAIDSKFPTPTAKKMGLTAELLKLRSDASATIADAFPEFSKALKTSEKAITRSQLLKPFKVNKTNPDQYSGFAGALGPALGGAVSSLGGSLVPLVIGSMATSPFAFGIGSGIAGSTAKAASSKLGARAIAQNTVNPLLEALLSRKKKDKSVR